MNSIPYHTKTQTLKGSENNEINKIIKNTSLVAKGALAHRLQRRTACKIENGRQVSTPRFLGVLSNFRKGEPYGKSPKFS